MSDETSETISRKYVVNSNDINVIDDKESKFCIMIIMVGLAQILTATLVFQVFIDTA